jgi:hypothetical protein
MTRLKVILAAALTPAQRLRTCQTIGAVPFAAPTKVILKRCESVASSLPWIQQEHTGRF